MNPYYDPSKPHHRPDGFRNNHSDEVTRSLADVMRWRLDAARAGVPKPPQAPIPTACPDLPRLQAYAQQATHGELSTRDAGQPSVTWIGHATALVQMAGLTLLTDPIFSQRASPLRAVGPKRHQPPGLALHELPQIDLVLASHNHYDHLDEASVKALNRQPGGPPLFVVPLGLKPWLAARGIRHAVELDWWDHHRLPQHGVDVVLVPAQHWSARGLNDRMMTLWGGFAVFADDCHLFYAGDTGYSRDFSDVRQRFAERQTAA
ncbi:MBL fold metallo-hydrolase, partial [Aquabacterium sp.]|uniref:MBL fold metallo-hydrolase n=1 Tax=Aquabacterium sp. TaxID=1872578 RepID=UPI002CBF0335